MQSDLTANLTQLVNGSHTSEAALRTTLRNTLVQLGFNADIEHRGADVVPPDKRIVIEVKLKVGPELRGSREDETQFEQLKRYIEWYQQGDEQPPLFDTSIKKGRRGILTNGRGWWVWDWPSGDGTPELAVEQKIFRALVKSSILERILQVMVER